MDKSLSLAEINDINKENNVMLRYPELENFRSILDIFDEYNCDAFVLLYQTDHNYGHWTCVIKRGDNIEFYDPYSSKSDDSIEHMKAYLMGAGHNYYPHLIRLLLNTPSKYKLHYNQFPHQMKKNGVNTCGRHVGLRMLFKDLPIEEYHKKLFGNIKRPVDSQVVEITNELMK